MMAAATSAPDAQDVREQPASRRDAEATSKRGPPRHEVPGQNDVETLKGTRLLRAGASDTRRRDRAYTETRASAPDDVSARPAR